MMPRLRAFECAVLTVVLSNKRFAAFGYCMVSMAVHHCRGSAAPKRCSASVT